MVLPARRGQHSIAGPAPAINQKPLVDSRAPKPCPRRSPLEATQMTIITTGSAAGAWRPDVYSFAPTDAVPQAAILQATTVSGVVDGDAPSVRAAYINDDTAQFTAEGAEIPEGDPQLAKVLVHTAKITQLVRVSSEQWGQPSTATQFSQSVARALVRRADIAFLAEHAPTAP